MDTVIDGRFFIDGKVKETSVGIEDGKIITVGNIVRGGDERIDFKDRLILPGFVDPHVHFRDPGLTKKEDFSTGTMSALFGGYTCVLDMPNTEPPVTDLRKLKEKKDAVRSKANIDYGLFAALTPECNVEILAPEVCGFKLFMGSTTGNILMNDDEDIYNIMCKVARTGKVTSVHAEDNSMILSEPERNNWDHLKNRPLKAEQNAIKRLGRYKGMKINICHVTDAESLDMAKSFGFTTEVTAHHMFFCAEDSPNAEVKTNPPIRNRAVRDGLVTAFKNGKAAMFGSDHAPHTLAEKSSDYESAPGGVPSVETNVPIFMNLIKHGSLSLELIVSMCSDMPSRTFGINKGKIAPGYDADFAVFDMHDIRTVNSEKLHSRAGYSPYDGMEAIFPSHVFVRGEMQLEDGEYCGSRIGRDIVAGN